MDKSFSEFIRNGTEEEKQEVFSKVIDDACEQQSETIKKSVLSEKWNIHTATGCSVRSESGQIVFEYPLSVHRERINIEEYKRWLDYADHICELHNQFIEGR